ncbi:hypothetical protein [Pseudoalteromonas luteoviolacea]|uniref:Uncharacterized protein n=2 Tax=Pseudoalteromonas luteoviolacea TaxID=43657 RepID=A0A0F6AC32_9GAMM|nr:hypothetical protein [Pseudoalteromonas luteoviolacea]AOT06876.1 hypothetical protein S4054249_02835 [Pseudoalteromonas luteoviolacea]AOT11794.1 hypothetical protein S40542_02835 [Pseudoalteromonas luteoviolacea]AOT16706.1 hypothetical protein S4054_02835 [Pseudoalteromonas luteoviolacea]KID55116.1 hypothetical protein JF50_25260 [Pseudoalteromonas luteoviolacea]KKE83371.1 hypothetical protein N479_14610 [Pseudoalteromonas luteoviolacea S4054]
MNKKIAMAVIGAAMGLGTSLAVSASNFANYTNGCNWKGFGTLENYCGYQYYVCLMGGTPGYNCRTIKAQCMRDCA